MNVDRAKEVFSDRDFVSSMFAMDTAAQVRAALAEKGVDMTEDEILELRENMVKLSEEAGENGELSLDQLDEAAGGAVLTTIGVVAAVAVGTAIVSMGVAGATTLGVIGAVAGIGKALSRVRW